MFFAEKPEGSLLGRLPKRGGWAGPSQSGGSEIRRRRGLIAPDVEGRGECGKGYGRDDQPERVDGDVVGDDGPPEYGAFDQNEHPSGGDPFFGVRAAGFAGLRLKGSVDLAFGWLIGGGAAGHKLSGCAG